MPHPCKSGFWGDGADLLIWWLDYLDSILPQQSVSHLTPLTWDSVRSLQAAIEVATDTPPSMNPIVNQPDANLDPGVEAEFQQVVQVLIALLIADRNDNTPPNAHVPLGPGWMKTGLGNPDPVAMKKLVGDGVTPRGLDPKSVLGRVRNSLGS